MPPHESARGTDPDILVKAEQTMSGEAKSSIVKEVGEIA